PRRISRRTPALLVGNTSLRLASISSSGSIPARASNGRVSLRMRPLVRAMVIAVAGSTLITLYAGYRPPVAEAFLQYIHSPGRYGRAGPPGFLPAPPVRQSPGWQKRAGQTPSPARL